SVGLAPPGSGRFRPSGAAPGWSTGTSRTRSARTPAVPRTRVSGGRAGAAHPASVARGARAGYGVARWAWRCAGRRARLRYPKLIAHAAHGVDQAWLVIVLELAP